MKEVKLKIATDILGALDPLDPGEVLIFVDQDDEGLVLDIEAGPGLTVEDITHLEDATE